MYNCALLVGNMQVLHVLFRKKMVTEHGPAAARDKLTRPNYMNHIQEVPYVHGTVFGRDLPTPFGVTIFELKTPCKAGEKGRALAAVYALVFTEVQCLCKERRQASNLCTYARVFHLLIQRPPFGYRATDQTSDDKFAQQVKPWRDKRPSTSYPSTPT